MAQDLAHTIPGSVVTTRRTVAALNVPPEDAVAFGTTGIDGDDTASRPALIASRPGHLAAGRPVRGGGTFGRRQTRVPQQRASPRMRHVSSPNLRHSVRAIILTEDDHVLLRRHLMAGPPGRGVWATPSGGGLLEKLDERDLDLAFQPRTGRRGQRFGVAASQDSLQSVDSFSHHFGGRVGLTHSLQVKRMI